MALGETDGFIKVVADKATGEILGVHILGPEATEIIHEFAHRGTTILVTTHYMDEAERCDRLAFMSRGHLIALGTPDAVTKQFGAKSVEDVFIELQRKDEIKAAG